MLHSQQNGSQSLYGGYNAVHQSISSSSTSVVHDSPLKGTIPIKVRVNYDKSAVHDAPQYKCRFTLREKYSLSTRLGHIADRILKNLTLRFPPVSFKIRLVHYNSFTGTNGIIRKQSILAYDRSEIIKKGLRIDVEVHYEHTPSCSQITCPSMKQKNSSNPMDCDVYSSTKDQYQWNEDNLKHLSEFSHFEDEFEQKPICRYGNTCHSYVRLDEGGNELKDRYHIKLYRHPPRSRNIKLAENMKEFVFNHAGRKMVDLYVPTNADKKMYKWIKRDGFLRALIAEVRKHGYYSDLCQSCGKDDDCKHRDNSMLQVVDKTMNHPRHQSMGKPLNRAEILAIILYTGGESNYALCKSQRAGYYVPWRWFDYCLYSAIFKLSCKESGEFAVYSGFEKTQCIQRNIEKGYFQTYMSTSFKRKVAEAFIKGGDGMLIQIEKEFKNAPGVICCDVSWISKFPDESEILFARTAKAFGDSFQCVVLDSVNGIQVVKLGMH